MHPNILAGLSLIALGAFAAGSFAVPFARVKEWKWETQWLVYSAGAYVFFPLTVCMVFSPDLEGIYRSTQSVVLLKVFVLGAVYGIGNLSFGLALRYLGLSLGYALSLGLMLAIGTLIPPMIDGRLRAMMETSGGGLLIVGIVVASGGIALSAWAGLLKDREVSTEEKQKGVGEYDLAKGFLSCILVGIAGSAMALGIEQGVPISDVARDYGVDPLFAVAPLFVVLLSGTFVTTLVWCLFLGHRNGSLKEYVRTESGKIPAANYAFALLAGLLWFSQFVLYGMGKSKMGEFSFIAWGILMALVIACATIWGLIRREWKGASLKAYAVLVLSLVVIVISSFIIGMSGSQ